MVAKEERDKLGELLRRTVHRYRSAIGASVYSFIVVYQQKSFSSESPQFHNSVLLKLIAVINQAPRHYTLSAHSIYLITIAAARIILPPTRSRQANETTCHIKEVRTNINQQNRSTINTSAKSTIPWLILDDFQPQSQHQQEKHASSKGVVDAMVSTSFAFHNAIAARVYAASLQWKRIDSN